MADLDDGPPHQADLPADALPNQAGLPAHDVPLQAGISAPDLAHQADLPAHDLSHQAELPGHDLPHQVELPAHNLPNNLPQADHPVEDPPNTEVNTVDPFQHPPLSPPVHPTMLSYSAAAQIFPKTPARISKQPGSPAGWGAVDPTRVEADSDSGEEESALDTCDHPVQVEDLPDLPLHGGDLQQVPAHPPPQREQEHSSPLNLLPS